MNTYCIILARAGSKGLPGKNVVELCGRPMVEYTIDHALAAHRVTRVAVTTDDAAVAAIARRRGVEVIDRPADLATDTATVDTAARHAIERLEATHGERADAVVILYANIPLRPLELIDRALDKLASTGCDSVQSVYPVGKNHPFWMRRLDGPDRDRLAKYQPNEVYRRQDLPPVYMLNGGIIAVTRRSLFTVAPGQPHAFLGSDSRAIVTAPEAVVDIDTPGDLLIARATIERQARGDSNGGIQGGAKVPQVVIGDRRVAPDGPTFVIAEIGVNHDGRVERACELVHAAADAGADAVKVQVFDSRLLLSAEAELAAYQSAGERDVHAMLSRLQLSPTDLVKVRDTARAAGIRFIATCFSIELTPLIADLDVDAVKLASPDAVNLPLIDAVAMLDKPLLASTGTCRVEELAALVMRCADRPLALLHCVSAYPTPMGQANLRRIGALAALYGRPTGYSDHTTDPTTGAIAVAQGACIIEKHLTWNRAAQGPDHAASFDPDQFVAYVDRIRAAESMLSADPWSVQEAELEVRRVSRQSVCVVRDLAAGHVLTRADLTVKRPGTGVPAASLEDCVGKRLARTVKANHLLHAADLAEAAADADAA